MFAIVARFIQLGNDVFFPLVFENFDVNGTTTSFESIMDNKLVSKSCFRDIRNEETRACSLESTCMNKCARFDESTAEPSLQGIVFITIIAATEHLSLTNHESRIVRGYTRHISKELSGMQDLGVQTRFRVSNQQHTGLDKYYRFFQSTTGGNTVYPYMLSDNLLKYAGSSESIFRDGGLGATSSCWNCREIKVVLYVPSEPRNQQPLLQPGVSYSNESNSQYTFVSPMRIVRKKRELYAAHGNGTGDQDWNAAHGATLGDLGCFSILHLQNRENYDNADVDIIYSALLRSMHCLRQTLGIPAYLESETTAAYPTLSISSVEWAWFVRRRMTAMHYAFFTKLYKLIELYQFRESWWRLFAMNSLQLGAFGQILRQIRDVNALVKVLSDSNGSKIEVRSEDDLVSQDDGCAPFLRQFDGQQPSNSNADVRTDISIGKLDRLLRSTYELLLQLETDPDGFMREATSLEQYFAIFGPYWLPLIVPAYRALRSAFI